MDLYVKVEEKSTYVHIQVKVAILLWKILFKVSKKYFTMFK